MLIRDFHVYPFITAKHSLSITNTPAKVGFSFYFSGLLIPSNQYVIRINLKENNKITFSKL